MHPNPTYRQTPRELNLAFARERGFGILALNGPEGPLAAHVPFVVAEDCAFLELHLVRSNPVARALAEPQSALLAVSGPDAYISPDWYATDHQVPTWNYIAVHLRGTVHLLAHEEMRGQLDRLSATFENRLLPKTPWLTAKMPDETLDRMLRQIVPARMDIAQVDGTWKLAQNKTEAARLAAAGHVGASPVGGDPQAVARLMRAPPS
ncbi:MAG: FMN-binding negative transcriptional regulator [Paracoccaceae bacterium]